MFSLTRGIACRDLWCAVSFKSCPLWKDDSEKRGETVGTIKKINVDIINGLGLNDPNLVNFMVE